MFGIHTRRHQPRHRATVRPSGQEQSPTPAPSAQQEQQQQQQQRPVGSGHIAGAQDQGHPMQAVIGQDTVTDQPQTVPDQDRLPAITAEWAPVPQYGPRLLPPTSRGGLAALDAIDARLQEHLRTFPKAP